MVSPSSPCKHVIRVSTSFHSTWIAFDCEKTVVFDTEYPHLNKFIQNWNWFLCIVNDMIKVVRKMSKTNNVSSFSSYSYHLFFKIILYIGIHIYKAQKFWSFSPLFSLRTASLRFFVFFTIINNVNCSLSKQAVLLKFLILFLASIFPI